LAIIRSGKQSLKTPAKLKLGYFKRDEGEEVGRGVDQKYVIFSNHIRTQCPISPFPFPITHSCFLPQLIHSLSGVL
jgi:hypothetical protein